MTRRRVTDVLTALNSTQLNEQLWTQVINTSMSASI